MGRGFGFPCCDCEGLGAGICYMGKYYLITWPTSGFAEVVLDPDATLKITYVSATSMTLELRQTSTTTVQWTETGLNPSTFGSLTKTGLDLIKSFISDGSSKGSCGRTKGSCVYSPDVPRENSSFKSGTDTMAAAGNLLPSSGGITTNECYGGGESDLITPLSEPGVINFFASLDVDFNNETSGIYEVARGLITIGGSSSSAVLESGAFQTDGGSSNTLYGQLPGEVVSILDSARRADSIQATLTGRIESYFVLGDLKHKIYTKASWQWHGLVDNIPGPPPTTTATHSDSGTFESSEYSDGDCDDLGISIVYGVRSSSAFYTFDPSLVTDSFKLGIG